jgi:hypothetical protein
MSQNNILFPVSDSDFANESLTAILGWISGKSEILVIKIDCRSGVPLDTAFFFPFLQNIGGAL